MANPDDPRSPEPIADDSRIAACGHDGMLYAALLQNADATIHRVAFGDAAEIDAHALVLETNAVGLRIEQQIAKVDRGQRRLDLRFGRFDVLAIVVEIPN